MHRGKQHRCAITSAARVNRRRHHIACSGRNRLTRSQYGSQRPWLWRIWSRLFNVAIGGGQHRDESAVTIAPKVLLRAVLNKRNASSLSCSDWPSWKGRTGPKRSSPTLRLRECGCLVSVLPSIQVALNRRAAVLQLTPGLYGTRMPPARLN
jgi:hypothetical protein